MKKSFLVVPAGAFAIGAAALYMYRKTRAGKNAAPAPKGAESAAAGDLKTGAYEFASGYKDAKTVKVTVRYDPEGFSYTVASEDFIADTGDSHVAILRGEDFGVQIEYAAYHEGEDLAALSRHIAQCYKGYGEICCNGIAGIRYYSGKSLCLAFPATGADHVLVTAALTGDDGDDEYLALWDNDQLQAMLGTLTISAQ